MQTKFLIGTHLYPARGAALERMENAIDSWRSLHVPLVDLGFKDSEDPAVEGFTKIACLGRDSCSVTNSNGIRKPLLRDLFDGLWNKAIELSCEYFIFSNADIFLTSRFGEVVNDLQYDSAVFTRFDVTDFANIGEGKIFFRGQDTFAVRTDWWTRYRNGFPAYIVGESIWDNVYTARLSRLGSCKLFYDRDLCIHQKHDVQWSDTSVFGHYNQRLVRRYDDVNYTMWSRYIDQLVKLDFNGSDFLGEQSALWEQLSHGHPGGKATCKAWINRIRSYI